ncbi:MAG: GHKL domain-containing protein [Clostridia bacterium]|nr:GHKL domain-containing protein [Clostridia bacterium]
MIYITAALAFLLGGAAAWHLRGRELAAERQRRQALEQDLTLLNSQLEERDRSLAQLAELRHDLRHHTTVLQGLVESGDLPAAEAYLSAFSPLQSPSTARHCANTAVNALACHYFAAAEQAGITVDAVLEIGTEVGIDPQDLCVVFGNCLENAVEAARQTAAEQSPYLRIRTMDTPGWLSVVMENSCPPGSLRPAEGGFLSGKEEGRIGIGLRSIRAIAGQYGGTAAFEMADGRFRTAVILLKRDETT